LDFGGEVSFLVNASQVRVVVLGGLVVTVLAILPKVRAFKPCRDYVFSRSIKIQSTTSFGKKVKLLT
jgi:hypothetical protein